MSECVESEPIYQKRCVLYLDILGFRSLIDDKQEELVYRLLKSAKSLTMRNLSIDEELGITSFSDSIVLSLPLSADQPTQVVSSLATQLALEFISESVMTRGAIVIGDLHHKGGIVFGPALNVAYDYEQRLAKYPRIIVSEEFAELHDSFLQGIGEGEWSVLRDVLRTDFDGLKHLNIFHYVAEFPDNRLITNRVPSEGDFSPAIEKIMQRRSALAQGTNPRAGELDIVAKYDWLKTYYDAAQRENEEAMEQAQVDSLGASHG